jgi:hypothetical protein
MILLRSVHVFALVTCIGAMAHADDRRAPPEEPSVAQAREEFVRGAGFVKNLQYADALSAFEHSAKLRPHAATTYNIGVCLRAMGQYTLARKALDSALKEDAAADGKQLSDTLRSQSTGFLGEIDHVLSSAAVSLKPADAAIAVDGRPLEAQGSTSTSPSPPTLVAGTRPPGPGEPASASFTLILDPGAHVLTLSRKGFADVILNRTFLPGARTELDLELDRLPATLHLASDRMGASVSVNDVDVGVAPIDITRPSGSYRVVVRDAGYVPYESQVAVQPGEHVNLMAKLNPEKRAITSRWWFWTAAGVVVAGAAIGTYFATRPAPERPPVDGGGLGWAVQAQGWALRGW